MTRPDLKRFPVGFVGLASIALLCGCTSGDSSEPKPSDPTRDASIAINESTPSLLEGRDYSVVASWPQVIGRRFVDYRASLDKTHAIAILGDDVVDPSAEPHPRGHSLVEVDTPAGDLRILAQHGRANRARYITDVEVSGEVVVWTETESTALDRLPWDIYSLDLTSRQERHLASSRDFGVKDPPPPSPTYDQQIAVVGDAVYFPAVERVVDEGVQTSVFSVPLTAEKPRSKRVVPLANQVFADGNRLRVMLEGKLTVWDPVRGAVVDTDKTLEADCGAFFSEGVSVICNKVQTEIVVVRRNGEKSVLDISSFDRDEPASAGYLYANSRWVAFTVNGSQGFVFDLKRNAAFKLDDVENSPQFSVADHWLPYKRTGIYPIPKKLEFFELTN